MQKGFLVKRNSNRGMSLVELLCVMAILSVVMLAVMSLYVPAQRATVTQTQVSDVQSNLRLALRVMTRDILTAGFLLPDDPIVFPDADPNVFDDVLDSIGTKNTSEFYLRTRIVGDAFARIESGEVVGGNLRVHISETDMIEANGLNRFPAEARVRLFDSVNTTELNPAVGTDIQRAHRVVASDATAKTIDIDVSAQLTGGETTTTAASLANMQAVVVKVANVDQPPLQTIRYRLANGTLERYVNGTRQILARNIDTSDTTSGGPSFFDFVIGSDGRVRSVDIKLSGITAAGKAGTLSEQKTREIQTSIKLRNVS